MARVLEVISPIRDRSLRRSLGRRGKGEPWVPSMAKKGTYNRSILSIEEENGRSIVLHATKGYRSYHV